MNMAAANRLFFLVLAVLLSGVAAVRGAEDGRSVVVVYNQRVPASKEVADHYAAARGVPAEQVFGFNLSEGEGMSRAEFRFELQEPLFKRLKEEGFFETRMDTSTGRLSFRVASAKIRYLVLCYGVPTRIQPEPTLEEAAAKGQPAELRRNEAAVDSELAWLPIVESRPALSGPMANEFYSQTNSAAFHPTNGILMTARIDGPTPAIARGLVDKAMQAETNGLWGRMYFDLRGIGEGEYKLGDDWLRSAAEISRQLGFETIVDERPTTFSTNFPMSHIAFYAGWYDGNVSGPFTLPEVDFMPGAIAYHLHSFSAATIRSTSQNWVGPLLGKGATATVGFVYEPYLGGTLDVGVFASRLIFLGFSLGEAAWAASPVLSWQTTVVGDPLYRPFALSPQQRHESLAARNSSLIEWSHLRVVDLNLAIGSRKPELVSYLEETPETKTSAVLSEKLAGLYADIGKPNSAVITYRRALELSANRFQRARLYPALVDQLLVEEKSAEAEEVLERFGRDFPEHRERLESFRQMLKSSDAPQEGTEAEQLRQKLKEIGRPPVIPDQP